MSGAAALGGLGGSLEHKDCELLCPVCFELIDEAYVTRCGHSFCYACIAKAVELHRRCPKCGAALAGRDHYFPNFLLNELVARRRLGARPAAAAAAAVAAARAPAAELRALLAAEARHLALPDVEGLLDVLTRRKRLLQAQSAAAQHRLLHDFLAQLLRHRTHQLDQLAREAALVKKDMEHVAGVLRELRAGAAELARPLPPAPSPSPSERASPDSVRDVRPRLGELGETHTRSPPNEEEESFASGAAGGAGEGGDALAARWRRLAAHFDDFVQCYFAHRADELYFPGSSAPTPAPSAPAPPCLSPAPCAPPAPPAPGGGGGGGGGAADADPVPQQSSAAETRASSAAGDQRAPESEPGAGGAGAGEEAADSPAGGSAGERYGGLEAFRADLAAFTRYRALRPLATLSYCSDAINYSTIVSTIEFDKDDEFFAIAGVTKRIKVFEFGAVVRDAVDVHYPCVEMQCAHKISCVSWNNYHKNVLASSDYEGTVSVWDVSAAVRTRALQEHDKRAWSVHFNRADVRLLASGGDDARVKLWALNQERSVATLEAKFNVCCVRFNPRSSAHLAFGSADHAVHYYDLRAPRAPLAVLRDHRKAVSYVQFLDAHSLVSASTDSQLKLWRVESPRCVRSFSGHANEKNFVGLATDGEYVACGSENNALYVYYAGLSRPLLAHRFDAVRGFLERERRDDEPPEFVSAVCWRRAPQRPALLAANSQGIIKVFEFGAVVRDAVDVHYPCVEMQCAHKISCVSWNNYHKNVLASSDYEGTVSVWDVSAAVRTRALQEHDKRAWSVHFNRADVRLLASGGDDARVKLWALNQERSVATLEAKFNVCCVRFNPRSSAHLAFGSADHAVHYYDLRAPRAPLAVLRDHRKAVSYVQFLDAHSLVSASTDSQLKLWRVESPRCVRSFSGHANEKNFVGLATDGEYVACGSENNALYVYYAGLSRPLLAHRFDAVRGFLERERRDDEPPEFVSAVCWRRAPQRPALLAANSQGIIKVLELV